jgi:hypothetical protein
MAFNFRSSFSKLTDKMVGNLGGSGGGGSADPFTLALPPRSASAGRAPSPHPLAEKPGGGASPLAPSPLKLDGQESSSELAALVGKLKRRGDRLEKKSAALREALTLALTCIDDVSGLVEALTSRPLGAFTVEVGIPAAGKQLPSMEVDPLLESLGSGVEAVLSEIAGLVKRGRAAAAAAVGRVQQGSSGGGGGTSSAPAKLPSSQGQLQAPFPGRALDV